MIKKDGKLGEGGGKLRGKEMRKVYDTVGR